MKDCSFSRKRRPQRRLVAAQGQRQSPRNKGKWSVLTARTKRAAGARWTPPDARLMLDRASAAGCLLLETRLSLYLFLVPKKAKIQEVVLPMVLARSPCGPRPHMSSFHVPPGPSRALLIVVGLVWIVWLSPFCLQIPRLACPCLAWRLSDPTLKPLWVWRQPQPRSPPPGVLPAFADAATADGA